MALPKLQAGIRRPQDVEPWVRTAQELLLGAAGAGGGGAGAGGLQPLLFSRNTVVLEVRGAPVSLTLVSCVEPCLTRAAGTAGCCFDQGVHCSPPLGLHVLYV